LGGASGVPSIKIVAVVVGIVLMVTIVLMAASFPVGAYTMFYTKISNDTLTPTTRVTSIAAFAGLYLFSIPVDTTYGGVFAFLLAIYAVLFAMAFAQGRGVVRALADSVREGVHAFSHNALLVSLLGLGAYVLGATIIEVLQTSAGVPSGSVQQNPLEAFVSLTIAPLREEIGFRVLFIGVVAFILSFVASFRTGLRSLWRPSVIYEGDPSKNALKWALYAMLFGSSIVFGVAHVVTNIGWQVGKVTEAAFAGIILGYLYIRYGFAAAVLMHWGVDYFGTVYAFFGQGTAGIPWDSSSGTVLENFVSFDILLFLGVPGIAFFAYELLRGRLGRRPGVAPVPEFEKQREQK
jgi:hypothetical protein